MKFLPSSMFTLATALLLASPPASARDVPSGPGMMRCTVVLSRLSSQAAADRMPVLTWAQGYLSGIASVASGFDGTSEVEVPQYDELQPRILALCRAEPGTDLFHVARKLTSKRGG